MKWRYFEGVESLEELRRQYKDLLKKFHPDNAGGSEEDCKALNAEYETVFSALKAGQKLSEEKSYESMKWDAAEDVVLRNKLREIIHMAGINITIVGCWIWIDGNTFPHKNELKAAGFKWAREKKKWYWHSEAFRKRSRKKLSFSDICGLYGAANVETETQLALG